MTELEMKENPVIASEDSKGIEPWKVSLPIRNTGHWIRFKEELNYAKPNCNLIQGVKESGKSSLVENLTTHYAEQHEECKIVEAFGSRDLEGLSWCRSPYKNSILFLIGDSVNVHSRWDNVRISKL